MKYPIAYASLKQDIAELIDLNCKVSIDADRPTSKPFPLIPLSKIHILSDTKFFSEYVLFVIKQTAM